MRSHRGCSSTERRVFAGGVGSAANPTTTHSSILQCGAALPVYSHLTHSGSLHSAVHTALGIRGVNEQLLACSLSYSRPPAILMTLNYVNIRTVPDYIQKKGCFYSDYYVSPQMDRINLKILIIERRALKLENESKISFILKLTQT